MQPAAHALDGRDGGLERLHRGRTIATDLLRPGTPQLNLP